MGTGWGPQPTAPCPCPHLSLPSSPPKYLCILPKAAPAAGRNIRGAAAGMAPAEQERCGTGTAVPTPRQMPPGASSTQIPSPASPWPRPELHRFPSRRSHAAPGQREGPVGAAASRDSTLMPAMNINSGRRQALTRPPAGPRLTRSNLTRSQERGDTAGLAPDPASSQPRVPEPEDGCHPASPARDRALRRPQGSSKGRIRPPPAAKARPLGMLHPGKRGLRSHSDERAP